MSRYEEEFEKDWNEELYVETMKSSPSTIRTVYDVGMLIIDNASIITQDMQIMKELLAWRGYSLNWLLDDENKVRHIELRNWIEKLQRWALDNCKIDEDDIDIFGKLVYFCIRYVCIAYKPELVDIIHVKRLLSARMQDKDFFPTILILRQDIPGMKELRGTYERKFSDINGLEKSFLKKVNKVLSEYIDTLDYFEKERSIRNWARKMSKDCEEMAKHGYEIFYD